MKKFFFFSLGFLFLSLIFLVAYNVAFKNNANNPLAETTEKSKKEETKDTPPEERAPSTVILNVLHEKISSADVLENGEVIYYSLDDRSFKKASSEGKDKTILLSNLPSDPLRVVWSPKKDRVLALLQQTSGPARWHFIDLTTKTLTPLKNDVGRLTWDNLGDKIFYQYTDQKSDKRTLNTSNPDGTNWKEITPLRHDSYIAPVPRSISVSFWNKPNALEKTFFETASLSGENRRLLLAEKFGADYLWSPNGERILVSLTEEKGGHRTSLGVMNSNGGEFQNLQIPTLISKTIWSKDNRTVYFSLPGSLPENAMLPNDYFEKSLHTKDTFWKMDVLTGKKTRIVDLKEVANAFDSNNLLLSRNEESLFFIDRVTKQLFRIDL
ncbi:MAG: hypothetical protein HYV45_02255 [Candidatus Moranbacteria bacterium]|nr:hypothetical protein [Candidatus Moranbacteria bacterium]